MASFWLWLPPLDPALHAILRGFVATAVAKQWWSHLARIFEIASFEVHGPFKIDYEKRRGGRTLVFVCAGHQGGAAEFQTFALPY
jgi:hypothetical protein